MVSELRSSRTIAKPLVFTGNGTKKRLVGLKNGQNQGFAVTDSSTVRFFMLFIPCVLQDIFEKLSCSKG
jgi:hypothetical protein